MASTGATAERATVIPRTPRAMMWVLLLASALAILLTGVAFSVLILSDTQTHLRPPPRAFWGWALVGCGLTAGSLFIRALRWVFLLRRGRFRIPLRDAYVGYFVGLSLLFVPFLLGEMAVRAVVQRSRNGIPVAGTCIVNLWERYLDVCALAVIAAAGGAWTGEASRWTLLLLAVVLLSLTRTVRQLALASVVTVGNGIAQWAGWDQRRISQRDLARLTQHRTWLTALGSSVCAWMLPAVALWGLARASGQALDLVQAEHAFAAAVLRGVIVLAPGGVLIVGENLLAYLTSHGFSTDTAALTTFTIRLATAGLATTLGIIFVAIHLRSPRRASVSHFDAIAHAYDAQIPEARRLALLTRKTQLMARILRARGNGARGLDVGCGQGWYVARMRELGFDMQGIDESQAQIDTARRHVGDPRAVYFGSVLQIPSDDASFDFAYCINVLHHLASVTEQRAAFAELMRVLRPGGLLFVHEINTRNLLFRFYMGYVFPSLNCVDEGVERWLLPHRLHTYAGVPVLETEYFTFLPEFLPNLAIRLLTPVERLLESTSLRIYSAHYMAVLEKPAGSPEVSRPA